MIGILSSRGKKEIHSKYFFQLLNSFTDYKDKYMFIFSIDDMDFLNKTVCGNLISNKGIEFVKIPIPAIIFNLTYHRKRSSIKDVRTLALHDDVIVVNEVNRFRQYMIMEMLTSNIQAQYALLEYEIRTKKDIDNYKEGFIVLSEKGHDYSKTRYLSDKQKFIIFDKRDLLLSNNDPVIITFYAQRGINGIWKALPGLKNPKGIVELDSLTKELKSTATEAAEWISNFIPSLGLSTVKFVLDKNLNPYLISFNGWDSKILCDNSDNKTSVDFIKNIFDYTDFLSIEQQGGVDLVD